MSSRKTTFPLALITALAITGLWVALCSSFAVEVGDFPAFYTGAVLAHQGHYASLHDTAEQIRAQAQFLSVARVPVYFVRPHVYAAFLSPLGYLSLKEAFAVWVGVQAAIWCGIGLWARRRFGNDALILMGLFPPVILAVGFGQDPAIFLGLAVLSFIFYERGWLLAAGVALGCAFIKPHLLLLFPVVLLVQRRWRMLAGFALAGAAEALLSLVLGGFEGARVYLQFLREQEAHLTPEPQRMVNLQGLLVNLGLDYSALRWALIALVAVGVARIAMRGSWWQAMAAALAGSALVAPHVFMYDTTLLVLPALLMFFQGATRRARIAATVFFTPLPYLVQLAGIPWTIAPGLVVLGLMSMLFLDGVTLPEAELTLTAPPRPAA